MQLRSYQREAVNATWRWFKENPSGAPLLVVPTGGGKSLLLATLAKAIAEKGADRRVLIVVDSAELVQQNFEELAALWPFGSIGKYSAGLRNSRDTHHQVIVAGIHSIYHRTHELGAFTLCMVDECHMTPPEGEGMYRTFFEGMREQNPNIRFLGMTATPYRMGTGMLTDAGDLWSEVAYDISIKELIKDGYLCPIISKGGLAKIDSSKLAVQGGEYKLGEMETAFNRLDIVEAAVEEIVMLGKDRRSWLIFAAGVSHAERIHQALVKVGVSAGIVTGKTPPLLREQAIRAFKSGEWRALVNCGVLVKGFNHPATDLIAILRATQSRALFVQIAGRGTRRAEGKENCLLLDYGENALRLGKIDEMVINYRRNPITNRQEAKLSAPPMKECFVCRSVVPISVRECPDCSTPFPEPVRINHGAEASDAPILSGQPEPVREVEVQSVKFQKWKKPEKPHPTLRCDYVLSVLADVPISTIPEWVCLEHPGGMARDKAVAWWLDRVRHHEDPIPMTIDEALTRTEELRTPKKIQVQRDGKFWRVIKVLEFHPDSSGPDFFEETGINI